MRDILFKGKAHDKWVEGCLIAVPEYDYFCILGNEDKLHPMDYPYLDGDFGTFDGKATPVDPETICQFTGLLDKNGNKIWEHDIVSAVWYSYIEPIEDITGRVVFDQGWCAYVICDESMGIKSELNGCGAYTYEFEVLGNVFDNPEILER